MPTAMASRETVLHGISGSPGICIGKAYLVDREGVAFIERIPIEKEKVTKEINRFKRAVSKAKNELADIIKSIPRDLREQAYILESHMLLHKDKMLYGKTIDTIEKEQVNAEWALKTATTSATDTFKNISDPYLKGRSADIEHVSDRIMRHLTGATNDNIADIRKRVILVAHNLSPAETSQLQLDRIMGFITDRGGRASHTSIIARTLEIPAVMGLEKATSSIRNGDLIIVDGSEGLVIIRPEEKTLVRYEELQRQYEAHKADIISVGDLPAQSADGRFFKVMGNIELPEEVAAVKGHGGEGIGLFRTEFLYIARSQFPNEKELFNQYRKVVETMAPEPVTIRTLDINGDKEITTIPAPEEANPALGLRAIRFCLQKPEIFKTQLKAILRAAVYGSVRLLLPMISGCEEIEHSIRLIDEAAAELEKKGHPYNRDIKIGVMIEVPSAAIIADAIAEKVDFFSIGTNDLVQYTLAIDRGNRHVAHLYSTLHPAVIRMISYVVESARKNNKPTFMCGEMAAEPITIPFLMALEIDELSMAPQSIPEIKQLIRKIDVSKAKTLLPEIFARKSAVEVQSLMMEHYGDILSTSLYRK